MMASEVSETQLATRRSPFTARRVRGTFLVVVADIVLINLAFFLGYYARYQLQLFFSVPDTFVAPYSAYLPVQLAYTLMMLLFLALDGVYRQRREGGWFEELYRIGNATTTTIVIVVAGTFLLQPVFYSRLLPFEVGVLTILLLSLARLARRALAAELRKRGKGLDRVLIVGAGEIGRAVMRNLVARPELGYQVVGFVDDDLTKGDLGRFKALGGLESVGTAIKAERVDEVIITLPWTYHRTIMGLVRSCQAAGVRARVVPDLFQLSLSRVDFDDMGGIPLMGLKRTSIPRAGRLIKRALDISFALVALVLFAPVLGLIALLIRLDSPGPAVFSQRRVGEGGRPFDILKFRSMRVGAEEQQAQLQDLNQATGPVFKIKSDPRITRMGRLLRRSSLDEWPQFVNVLRGEMSVVGPRPGLPSEVAQYQPWQRQRLEVPPGITGLWQVSGRSDLTFDEMCLLDVYYIENWSLGMDLTIMLRTVPRVLFADGAY
jgi:exopolysaccharide biosynthesis polyprenyl glycosylphosphotransferase